MLQVSELPPIIPLQTLFGNPAKTSAQVLLMHLVPRKAVVCQWWLLVHEPFMHVPFCVCRKLWGWWLAEP